MDVKPGDVVVLKSGGQALTVTEVNETDATCLWIGDDGNLFRETLPLVALERAELTSSEDALDQDHDEENGEAEDEGDEEGERHVA